MMSLVVTVVVIVLQRPDTSSLTSSSLQRWQVAPLCNGKFKVINVGNLMSFVWFFLSVTLFMLCLILGDQCWYWQFNELWTLDIRL